MLRSVDNCVQILAVLDDAVIDLVLPQEFVIRFSTDRSERKLVADLAPISKRG